MRLLLSLRPGGLEGCETNPYWFPDIQPAPTGGAVAIAGRARLSGCVCVCVCVFFSSPSDSRFFAVRASSDHRQGLFSVAVCVIVFADCTLLLCPPAIRDLSHLLDRWDCSFLSSITAWRTLPAQTKRIDVLIERDGLPRVCGEVGVCVCLRVYVSLKALFFVADADPLHDHESIARWVVLFVCSIHQLLMGGCCFLTEHNHASILPHQGALQSQCVSRSSFPPGKK